MDLLVSLLLFLYRIIWLFNSILQMLLSRIMLGLDGGAFFHLWIMWTGVRLRFSILDSSLNCNLTV